VGTVLPMIASTPTDLAAAFRSFPRRLRDAVAPVAADPGHPEASQVRALEDQLARSVRETAAVLGLSTQGDLDEVAAAVAQELEQRPVRNWSDADLNRVRELATSIGGNIRHISMRVDESR
jgi:hypothetical protein